MTSRIAKRSAAAAPWPAPSGEARRGTTPASRGLWSAFGKDWVAGAVLVLVWTALWTMFTAGVLAPASRLAGAQERAGGRVELSAAPAAGWGAAR